HGPFTGRLTVVIDSAPADVGPIATEGAAADGQWRAARDTGVVDAAAVAGRIATQGAVGDLHGPGAGRRTVVEDAAAAASRIAAEGAAAHRGAGSPSCVPVVVPAAPDPGQMPTEVAIADGRRRAAKGAVVEDPTAVIRRVDAAGSPAIGDGHA